MNYTEADVRQAKINAGLNPNWSYPSTAYTWELQKIIESKNEQRRVQ